MEKKRKYKSTDGIFDIYFDQYIDFLKEKLETTECGQVLNPICIDGLIENISEELVSIASFSLIDFFTSKRESDETISYQVFNQSFLDTDFLEEFNEKYPMVKKLCNQVLENYLRRIEEVLCLIMQYKHDFQEFIPFRDIKDIREIDVSKGDYHENTFVAIIACNNKKVVLKKRFHIGERLLNILKEVYKKEGIDLPIINAKILSDNLVIQEFIEPTATFQANDLITYYRKFGLMAGVFTILGSKDLHNENVIATKKGPYFIDMEAAITPEMNGKSYSLLKETLLFGCSEMGMVYGNSDLSAFTGKSEPVDFVELINRGTDNIYAGMTKKIPVVMNIPKNEVGEAVNPNAYTSEVKAGYKQAIRIFLKYREEIIAAFKEQTGYDNRVVLRNTGFYGTYLFNLCLPAYMKSEEKYEELLLLLSKTSIRDKDTILTEIDCLRKHMIPYFTISNFIPENKVKEEFIHRLKTMNADDFEREEHYLNIALGIDESDNNPFYKKCSSQERISKEISRYKKLCLLKDTLRYGVKDLTIQNKILDYRNDLYTFGGTLLFLSKICPELKESIKHTVESNTGRKNISGLNGYHSGILLEKMFGIQSHARYKQAKELITEYDEIDFSTYGSSILALDYLYRETSEEKYLDDILFYGEKYLKKVKEQKLTGLFHGFSGDALVMNILKKYLTSENIYEQIESCIKKENDHYDTSCKNWLDAREEIDADRDMNAISYGAVGITLCRILLCMDESLPQNLRKMCETDIKKGIAKIIATQKDHYADDSLVNGYAGALFVLKTAKQLGYMDTDELKKQSEEYLRKGEAYLAEDVWQYKEQTYVYNPAFASGRIGTVFTLWYISGNGITIAKETRG